MKVLFVFLALATCGLASAQKASVSRSAASLFYLDTVSAEVYHTRYTLPAHYTVTDLADASQRYFLLLKQPGITLKHIAVTESPIGRHILLQPLYHGIPVYHSEVRLHIDQKQQVYLASAVLFPLQGNGFKDFSAQAAAWCRQWYNAEPEGLEQVIYCDGIRALNAVKFNFRNRQFPHRPELVVGENGEILYRQDMVSAYTNDPDSLVSGYIYRPDPLTTAQKFYGSPYKDSSDFTNPQLDSQRVMVQFRAAYINDTFRLQTKLFYLTHFVGSSVMPVMRTDTLFAYNRSQAGFEDVNAFYHVTNFYNYLTGSFGYAGLFDTLLIDTHGEVDDNSYFDPWVNPNTLEFGTGGVDDAEDADVIVHEFTHAMSANGSPNSNNGIERRAMEEGMADYSAASYSKSFSAFRYNEVYTWDGHNEFWDGRVTNSTKQYPTDLNGDIYNDCLIWSSALMEINDALGRTEADKIMYLTLFLQGSNMTMPQMARIVLKADTLLNGADNYVPIKLAFVHHNILQWGLGTGPVITQPKDIQLINTQAFATGTEDAMVKLPSAADVKLTLYDMQGRELWNETVSHTEQVNLSPAMIKAGVYLLTVQAGQVQQSFRLLRLAD